MIILYVVACDWLAGTIIAPILTFSFGQSAEFGVDQSQLKMLQRGKKCNHFSVKANSHKSNISVTRLKTNKNDLTESTEHRSDTFKEIVEKFLFFSS